MANYDQSQVGVPFVRVTNVAIQRLSSTQVNITISQDIAVLLADASIASIAPMASFTFSPDLVNSLNTPIPAVNPVTGVDLGTFTNLAQCMSVLASVVRQQQLLVNQ